MIDAIVMKIAKILKSARTASVWRKITVSLIGNVEQISSAALTSSATTERNAKKIRIARLERKSVWLEDAGMK